MRLATSQGGPKHASSDDTRPNRSFHTASHHHNTEPSCYVTTARATNTVILNMTSYNMLKKTYNIIR